MSIQDPALQTLPKRDKVVRKGFITRNPDDEVIMSCDLEQVEARVFSCLSRDTGLIDLFNYCDTEGEDFFTQIGREVYSEPGMVKDDPRRQLLKNMMYGRLYGAGIGKMALTAGVPDAQMKVVNDSFDARFPGMKNLMRDIENLGMTRLRDEGQAYIKTGAGRRLPADEGKVYTLVNYLIQGTSAEILKVNILKCDAAGLTPYLIVPVHDELVLSVPRTDQEEIGKILQECMTTRDGWTVPLLAGAPTTGDRWGELD
jgi:DNA polymerase-1